MKTENKPAGIIDTIEQCIKAAEFPIESRQIAIVTGIPLRSVQKNMYDVRMRNLAEWKQHRTDGRMHYAIGEKKARRTSPFTLPDDLWRGWRDPVTGYQPDRLGA